MKTRSKLKIPTNKDQQTIDIVESIVSSFKIALLSTKMNLSKQSITSHFFVTEAVQI